MPGLINFVFKVYDPGHCLIFHFFFNIYKSLYFFAADESSKKVLSLRVIRSMSHKKTCGEGASPWPYNDVSCKCDCSHL